MHEVTESVETLERIVANGDARRELLWLRARMKNDDEALQALERTDARIEERLRLAHGAFDEETDFGKVYDECLERHARTFALSDEPAPRRRPRGRR
jgi:hypothetical protein